MRTEVEHTGNRDQPRQISRRHALGFEKPGVQRREEGRLRTGGVPNEEDARWIESFLLHAFENHAEGPRDVAIPRQGFTVVTGVSGSGKSTRAFDIVFA